ncbi:hypothetical protein [Peribacillus sp. R9-11]|uniref:hypothetical protein n=1 Tax=Peribacillus sp. R9-11 TaxID=3073271 RepID=UPI002868DC92|nr:hypothetical protein [Peribacillus sp. R9-11]WMX58511.1 hypothetical protein RE409_28775 [Peribacillus sp. R9-11]
MNAGEKMVTPDKSYKKYRPVLYLFVLFGILVFFRHVILQLFLTVFLIACLGFILYKTIPFILNFGFFLLYLALSTVALVFAIGGGVWVLNLMG